MRLYRTARCFARRGHNGPCGVVAGEVITARHRSTALLVSGCFFMESLDGTIVTTAAPRIGAALHVASTAVAPAVSAYLITLTVLIPLSSWMAARIGARPVFLSAIIVFTVA